MSDELTEGTFFAGRYRVIRKIAAGGMGAVYEVEHTDTERRRALKVMHAHLFENDDMRERFKREAKVAARVDSPYIVDVFDAGVDDATRMPFLVMELLKGEELGKRIKRLGRLSAIEVVTYLQQVARALDKTHQVAIIHRDLKPDNVFLVENEDGLPQVKVLDYGIAKVIAEGSTGAVTTHMVGTPLYMAPEQFNPKLKQSGAADIYALGMMAYTCLVGIPYWAEEAKTGSLLALVAVAAYGSQEPASERASKVGVTLPSAFDQWFAQATAANPADRFPTATASVTALAHALDVPLSTRGTLLSRDESAAFQVPDVSAATPQLTTALTGTPPTLGTTGRSAINSANALARHSPDMTVSGAAATQAIAPNRWSASRSIALSLGAVFLLGGGVLALSSRNNRPSPRQHESSAHAASVAPMAKPSASSDPLPPAVDIPFVMPLETAGTASVPATKATSSAEPSGKAAPAVAPRQRIPQAPKEPPASPTTATSRSIVFTRQ